MNEPKKKHLYAVTMLATLPETVHVIAHTKQQAIGAIVERFVVAERVDAMTLLTSDVSRETIIDATVQTAPPEQQPLALPGDDGKTAAEALETGPHRITED